MDCSTKKRGKLCGDVGCKHCFVRSFASSSKANYLSAGQENPLLIPRCGVKKLSFDCPECGHVFWQVTHSAEKRGCPYCCGRKLCNSADCGSCFSKSFASHERSSCWDATKNKLGPRGAARCSDGNYWFICDVCNHSFRTKISSVQNGQFCPYCSSKALCDSEECKICFSKSFASNEKSSLWDLSKNKVSPRAVFKFSNKDYWFNCDVCNHAFKLKLNVPRASEGQFCSFCSGRKLCGSEDCKMCFDRSFAGHERSSYWDATKNKKSPREVSRDTKVKYWFVCRICQHPFETIPRYVLNGKYCPYCCPSGRLLCEAQDCSFCFTKSFASHPKAMFWCPENLETPREVYKQCNKKYFFVCEKGHKFASTLNNVFSGCWCPKCKHKSEHKLLCFLEETFHDVDSQFKVSWCRSPETGKYLPFDFCVSKTIIELDGPQHFRQISNWQTPECIQKNDRYKETCAVENGYSVLRLLQEDVWDDKIDWKKLLIENVRDYEEPVVKNLWTEQDIFEQAKKLVKSSVDKSSVDNLRRYAESPSTFVLEKKQ
ncbi:restriction endonuclease [Brazilian marseillevirus]|uniref:restriction endonuclease n=1 Tax=Brazilian marseillevirus TaxID=1813599 RepID=UPI000784DEF2|nr:restriction endonuclease [Brazilian marseillevirus]AMQ10961.1 restriction endonuclease [Brazilian marseillevirus]